MKLRTCWAIAFMVIVSLGWQSADACNYASKIRRYNKALAAYLANPTVTNAIRLCNIVRGIEIKFKNSPQKPTPVLPPEIDCDEINNGGGRGGGPGAVVVGIGQGAGSFAWVRNHGPDPCDFTWTITPEANNPPGFSFSATTGMITVPGMSSAPVFFDIMVDPAVSNGTMAFFRVTWMDGCTGLPLFDEFADFKVTADTEISVVPTQPFFGLEPGLPLGLSYRVTNHTGGMVSRPYTYFHIGDPASRAELNSGGEYVIKNIFQMDKSISGGTAEIPAFGEIIIDKDPLLAGEFCDPEMVNCCGLDFGGATCCAFVFNEPLGFVAQSEIFYDLIGKPVGGGFIGLSFLGNTVQIPTDPLVPIPIQLEQLTLQAVNQANNINGFNLSVMLAPDGIMPMHEIHTPIELFSTDPGLNWMPVLPPFQHLLEPWTFGEVDILGIMLPINGWEPMPLPMTQ